MAVMMTRPNLLGCDALLFDKYLSMFRRDLLPPSSGFNQPKKADFFKYQNGI
jgi:hypothetical protein